MKTFLRVLFAITIVCLASAVSQAQVNPNLETGLKPYGSYEGGMFDTVSLTNGNLTLRIPLADYPQRGGVTQRLFLVYNNKGWNVWKDCDVLHPDVCTSQWKWEGSGVASSFESGHISFNWTNYKAGLYTYASFTATTEDGAVHQLTGDSAGGQRAIDGSGIVYFSSAGSPTSFALGRDRYGNVAHASGETSTATFQDTNGNFLNYNSAYGDTLGRVLVSSSYSLNSTTMTLPAPGGGTRTIVFNTTTKRLQTRFAAIEPLGDAIQERGSTATFLTSVVINDGDGTDSSKPPQVWTFEYGRSDESSPDYENYGDLTKITMPNGGTISYEWATGETCDQSLVPKSRWVKSRTVDDGSGPQTTTYDMSIGSWGGLQTVTDPLGNKTVHTITGLGVSCSLYETKTQWYDTSGTLLKTVDTDYSYTPNPYDRYREGSATMMNVFPIRLTTTLPNGLVSKVEHDYDNSFVTSAGTTISYGMLKETREFGYDNISAPARRTVNTYLALENSTYFTANMFDRVSSTTVYDVTGSQVGKTAYGYDEYALQPSGVTEHRDTSLLGVRGNRTSVKRWLNTTGETLNSTIKYYDTGMPYQVTDPGGHTTTYTYSPTYKGAYVTQTCAPDTRTPDLAHHCVSGDYDFNTGRLTAYRDENNQQTTYAYDNFFRIQSASFPDGGSVNFEYSPDLKQVTKTQSITSGLSRKFTVKFDGLFREVHTQLEDPQGDILVDTAYDAAGRKLSVSNPYRENPDAGDPPTGLTQYEYDGLNRITKITFPGGAHSDTDYAGNIITTTDPAGHQRRTKVDALGRIVEVDEPGQTMSGGGSGTAASAATGTATLSGQVRSIAGTSGGGSVTISGSEQKIAQSDCPGRLPCYLYDAGSVSITVGSFTATVNYGQSSTSSSIATALAGSINGNTNSPVTATVSVATVNLTAKQTGAATNYSLSVGSTYDTADFTRASFTATRSGAQLAGGADPIYDTGSVSLTVNGMTKSANYGQGSTGAVLASTIANAFNTDAGSPVSVTPSGSQLYLSSKIIGSASNYPLSVSQTFNSARFAQASFTWSISGSTLTGGSDGAPPSGSGAGPFSLDTPFTTLYVHDALDNLTCVEQHGGVSGTGCSALPSSDTTSQWRVRRFTYDSVSRLRSATNPESGTTQYTYDSDGNVTAKTDARSIAINYEYDEVHRLKRKSYSNGEPDVNYKYDQSSFNGVTIGNGLGRRTGMTDASGVTAWSFDTMGRVMQEHRTVYASPSNITRDVNYTYNLDGSPATLTYPSRSSSDPTRRVITNDPRAGVSSAGGVREGSFHYVSDPKYGPSGGLTTRSFGLSTGVIVATTHYTARLQPDTLTAVAPSGTIVSFAYHFGDDNTNDGNVLSIDNVLHPERSQTFTYDPLDRLATAQSASDLWGENFTVDPWGNLTNRDGITGKTSYEPLNQPAMANNRLFSHAYDLAGNLKDNLYSYDAEGRLANVGGVVYTYDGDGKRVKKSSGKIYWTGVSGDALAETDSTGTITDEYIFLGGTRIARLAGSNRYYYFSDHLGTTRVIADGGSGAACYDADFYPFGGEQHVYVNTCPQAYKFTGKERDSETGLDYFGARYYGSNMGRFTSPDPKSVALRHLLNPQKLNKYSYVLNNPLALFDPDGQEEKTIIYRAFIPTQRTSVAGFTYAGDNRGFSTAKNASSRVSLSVTIETDPAKNPSGLVSMGKPQVGMSIELSPTIKTGFATQGLPHADVSRDANGNVVVNFQSNAKNPIGPAGQSLEPGIRADATVKVSPDGTQASAGGVFSGYPSHEINMTDANGTVPLLQVPAGNQPTDLLKNTVVPPQETMRPPACATDKKGCN